MKTILITSAVLLLAGAAHAVPIATTVATAPGAARVADALTGFMTTGNLMGGTVVTAYFGGGTSQSAVWVNGGGSFGSATGTDFTLSLDGDTFSAPWQLVNTGDTRLIRFTIDGQPGSTVFDIISSPSLTPGSSSGKAIDSADGDTGTSLDALYTNRLAVGGVTYGDLYTLLDVSIVGALAPGNTLSFVADTDNGDSRGIRVPAPGALALFGLGVMGLAARRRRG